MASKKAATMVNPGGSSARTVESRRELIPNPRRRTGESSTTTVKDTRSRTLPTEKDRLEAEALAKRTVRFSPKKFFSRAEGSAYKLLTTYHGKPSKQNARLRPSKEMPAILYKETLATLNHIPIQQQDQQQQQQPEASAKSTQASIAQKDKICETRQELVDAGTSSTSVSPVLISRSLSPGRLDLSDSFSSIELITDTFDNRSTSQEDFNVSVAKDAISTALVPVLISLSPCSLSPRRDSSLREPTETANVSDVGLGRDPRRFSLKFFRSSRRLTETKLKELREGLRRTAFFWSRESYRRQLEHLAQEQGNTDILFDTVYPLITPTAEDIEDMFNSREPKGLDGHRAPPNSPSIETLKSLKSFLTVSREPPDVIELGLFPVRTTCPKCHRQIVTKTSRRMGNTVYWAACALCLVFPPFAIVPFFSTAVYDVVHRCPRCGLRIGTFFP